MMDTGKGSSGISKPCLLIIVVASVERFAYKGVASNLVTFLTEELKMSTSAAAKSVNSWYGVTSMLPLVGAFFADSYWDRYSTVLCSSLLYVVGLVTLTTWALLCTWMPIESLFLPLYLISTAQGGYNPSLQAFGADQLGMDDEEEGKSDGKQKSMFFQWWYFGICSGSLLGNSLMSYIQDTYGWHLGFAIPTIAMGISVLCFLVGSGCYVHKQKRLTTTTTTKSAADIIGAVKAAVIRKVHGKISWFPPKSTQVMELELQEKSSLTADVEFEDSERERVKVVESYPHPRSVIRVVMRLLPIWTTLLMFAVIFQLPSTFFTKQGMVMRRNVGRDFVVPPASLQSAITISIIMLMPLYDKVIIPSIRHFTRKDEGIDVYQRIGIGMFLSIVAMVLAAIVEVRRSEISRRVSDPLSIFWLLPQYVLLGISDVFTVVGMQEFFYTQVPSTMRSIGIAIYLSVFGCGSFLGAFLISAIEFVTSERGTKQQDNGWFSDDMREAHLYKYYWFLALLSTASFLVFVYLCRYYYVVHDSADQTKEETNEDCG